PASMCFEILDSPHFFEAPGASYSSPAVNDGNDVFLTWRESTVYLAYLHNGVWQPPIGDGGTAAHTEGGTLRDVLVGRDGLPVVCWESFVGDNGQIGVGRARPL